MAPAATEEYVYSLPVETENRRLAGQHHGFKIAMGNRLVIAPLDKTQKGLRIMDGGTSDGYWLDDFRNELTDPDSCELLGTDVTGERFPELPPHGVQLHAYSSLGPFPDNWYSSFDLVHQRLTLAGLGNQSKACVDELLRLVKPGGWIQLVELDYNWIEPNPPAVKMLGALVARLAEGMGSDCAYRNGGMENWIREAGFIRVASMVAPVSIGAACPEPRWRAQTASAFTFTAQQLVRACRAFPGGLKVITEQKADNLGVQLEKELRELGGYFPLRVVWGMRPQK